MRYDWSRIVLGSALLFATMFAAPHMPATAGTQTQSDLANKAGPQHNQNQQTESASTQSTDAAAATYEFEVELSRTADEAARRRLMRNYFRHLATPAEKRAAIGMISNRYVSPIPLNMQRELLEPLLSDKEIDIRISAIHALGFVANRSRADEQRLGKRFVSLLSSDPPVRTAALMALGTSHRSEYAAAVSPYLRDPVPSVRAEAAFCLANLTAPSTTYLPQVAELLQDTDRNVRQRAVSALYNMNAKAAEPYLETMLADSDALLRVDVIRLLVYSHAVEALPALRRLSADPDDRVRREAEGAIDSLTKPAKR